MLRGGALSPSESIKFWGREGLVGHLNWASDSVEIGLLRGGGSLLSAVQLVVGLHCDALF